MFYPHELTETYDIQNQIGAGGGGIVNAIDSTIHNGGGIENGINGQLFKYLFGDHPFKKSFDPRDTLKHMLKKKMNFLVENNMEAP